MIKYNNSNINDWYYDTSNIIKVYRNNAVCYYKVSGTPPSPTAQTPCFAVVENISQYSDTEFEDVFNKADGKWYKLNNLNQYEEYGVYGSGRNVTTYEGKLTIDTETPPSRLPQGYTEVEYIENTSTAYIDTGFKPNQDTRITLTAQTVTSQASGKLIGSGAFNKTNAMQFCYEPSSTGSLVVSWGTVAGWTTYSSCIGDYNVHTYDWNKNEFYRDDTLVGSVTYANFQCTDNLGIFRHIQAGDSPSTAAYFKGKIFNLKIFDNGTLVRDFVPAKRDSDDKYGMYDIVNDVFYVSPNNVDFSGGEPVAKQTTYEYIYSGGSWVNVGAISGSSIVIKSPEYIERTSSYKGRINLDYVWKTNTKLQFKFYSTNNGGGMMIGELNQPDNNDCRVFFASTTAYFDYGSGRIQWSSNGQKNTLYEYEYGNYYIKNLSTSTTKTGTTFSVNRTNSLYLGAGNSDYFRTYYVKFYEGNTLVKDFIPWTDTNGNFGLYEKVSNAIYSADSGSFTASTVWTDVEVGSGYTYPIEYVVMQDPPDNVTFTSMTEAEDYECPWWGMTGIITNTDYLFCETNTWLTKYDYQEVSGEYLCDAGNKYKKLQEWDRNVDGTISATSIYVKGDLIETASPDCPQCTVNFCGVNANGGDVIINNGTTTLTQSNWTSPYPVRGEVGAATTTIGMYCFLIPSATLSALTIGNTVTTIEHEAFMETELLTTLTIPSNVTQIDFWAFTRCSGLQEVIFEGTTPPTFTNQYSGVFHDYCPPVIYVPDSAVAAYRAIDGTVWTNETWSTDIIQPISNRH